VGLPYRFTVGESATGTVVTPPVVGSYSSLLGHQTEKDPAIDADNARWLLETAQGKVSDDILSVVQATLEAPPRPTPSVATAQVEVESVLERATAPTLDSASCQPFLTPLRLGFWNSRTVRLYNNCYNYAANFVSNTLAQPGRRSGQVYVSFDCEAVVAAAAADGCMPACEGTHRVLALAIWPGFDFHWWRLHPDDIWAQKLGWWMATNRDNQGRVIGGGLTPEGCDRSPYNTFCGYFYAPLGMQVI